MSKKDLKKVVQSCIINTMRYLKESFLKTRAGTVPFKIDITHVEKPEQKNFSEVSLLGRFLFIKDSGINTLADLQRAIEHGFQNAPFAGVASILEAERRLSAFEEWLAQLHTNGAKNIILNSYAFRTMSNQERQRRLKAMGIE